MRRPSTEYMNRMDGIEEKNEPEEQMDVNDDDNNA